MTPPPWNFSENSSVLEEVGIPKKIKSDRQLPFQLGLLNFAIAPTEPLFAGQHLTLTLYDPAACVCE